MDKNYLSIDYHDTHEELSLNDNGEVSDGQIIRQLAEVAENENVLCDVEPYPCGYFYNAYEILNDTMKPILQKFLAEIKICLHRVDCSSEEIDAIKYFDDLWEYLYGNENADCKSADLIAESLELFIEQGKWQCGLKSTDAEEQPHPIVWFGLPDEEPLEYWTIDPCAEDALAIWFEEMDWSNIVMDEHYVSYWAIEGGIYLPDRSKLLDSCPIKIHDNMTREELIHAVESAYKKLRQ